MDDFIRLRVWDDRSNENSKAHKKNANVKIVIYGKRHQKPDNYFTTNNILWEKQDVIMH